MPITKYGKVIVTEKHFVVTEFVFDGRGNQSVYDFETLAMLWAIKRLAEYLETKTSRPIGLKELINIVSVEGVDQT